MTNELEKRFFQRFGIEPRYEDACTVEDEYWNNEELANEYGTFDQYMNCKCGDQENCTTECSFAYQREVYPQITDRILLELICIHNTYLETNLYSIDYESLKKEILKDLINEQESRELKNDYVSDDMKHQVRTLFEEG